MNFFKSMGKKLIRKERNRDPIMLTSADVALYQRGRHQVHYVIVII